jgi:hypothetical protein
MHELIYLLIESVVLLRQAFSKVFLINDLLRSLIAVKRETTTGALHDEGRT